MRRIILLLAVAVVTSLAGAATLARAAAPVQEWVSIDEPQTDDEQRLLGGKVVFHGPDRDEI